MNDLYKYDISKNEWQIIECSGDIPSPRSGFACTIVNDSMFIFGGLDPLYGWMTDGFIFDFGTSSWKKLTFSGTIPSPRDKFSALTMDGDKVVIFGGFGPKEIDFEDGEEETATFGWFDDTFILDTQTNHWNKLECSGECPPPCAAFGMTMVKRPEQTSSTKGEDIIFTEDNSENPKLQNFLYIIGGKDCTGRHSFVYFLNMSTLIWEKRKCRGHPPQGRSFHSCVSIGDKIILFGGVDGSNDCLNDMHILDTRAELDHAWVKIDMPAESLITKRAFHAATIANIEDDTLLYVHGGVTEMNTLTGEHLTFCNDMMRINISSLISYRAPDCK